MVVVATLAHRGASMLQRAFVPIVFLAMIVGKGGQGSLSHKVSTVGSDALHHGGASYFGVGTGGPHGWLGCNSTTSEWMNEGGFAVGEIFLKFPNASQHFSPSYHTWWT